MQDIAAAASVSLVTVSRAINAPDLLAPATLATVRATIERLHYIPDLTAGSLASNRSRIVGAIVPTIANSIFSDTVEGLAQTLAAAGYQLLLGQTGYRNTEERALVGAFVGRRVDGLVLTGVTHARGVRALAKRAGIPIVETWDMTRRPIDMLVGFSNEAAGRAAALYLAAKGYVRLVFVGGSDERSSARLRGFRSAMSGVAGTHLCVIEVASPSSVLDGSRALAALLRERARPRAVFCTNDMLAAGVLFECQRRGIPVPTEIAVMGFADLPIAAGTHPPLTTVQVRSASIGRRAGELLVARLAGDPAGQRIVDVGFAVVERESA